MIDGVTQRLANYRDGIERVTALIARRARAARGAAAGPRASSKQAIAEVPDRATARALFRAQNQITAALLAHDPAGAEQSAAAHAGAADRRSRASRRHRCLRRRHHFDFRHRSRDRQARQGRAGHRRPADRPGDRIVARRSARSGAACCRSDFARTLRRDKWQSIVLGIDRRADRALPRRCSWCAGPCAR